MWSSRVLGESTPEQLLNTIIYLLGVYLSLHAVEEHKALKIGYYLQIKCKCKYDKELEAHFIEYKETCSKNHQGGLGNLNKKPNIVTVYENKDQPSRYLIYLYKKYVGLRLSHDPKCSHDLYLRPLKCYTEHVWYSCQPIGVHTLQQVTSKLANAANLVGKQTNHSLQATGPMHLYQTGVDDKIVRELTRYRSNAMLEYKYISSQMKENVSQILYGNSQVQSVSQPNPMKRNWSEICSQMDTEAKEKIIKFAGASSQVQTNPEFTVNYNVPKDSIPPINVYPIVNIPTGLNPGTPVIANVNIHLHWICYFALETFLHAL